MAVQAQYPSNILLLDRNTQQESHDYSLQPQPGGTGVGGGFLEQSHLLFNNGGNNMNMNMNSRKRGREIVSSTGTAKGTSPIMNNPICFQQSQLIELSQLHQSNVVSTGLRLSSGDQQQRNRSPNLHHHQHQNINLPSQSSAFLSLFSDDFASHIKQQRDEIDQFLHAQEEQLRRTLAEKRQRHYRELLGVAEESAVRRLREKEAEVEKATRRNAELEARATRLNMEAQAWQAKARAQEATAATLQAQLQHAIALGAGMDKRITTDGGDCTVGGEGLAEDAESAHVDPDRVEPAVGPSCKACRKRTASVVLLPCRHFCLCMECDRVVQACPLCRALRNSSVEVFLS